MKMEHVEIKMKKVYDCGGECLGSEWVNLSGLQIDTKKAISQMIYLDELVDTLLEDAEKREGE